MLDTIHSHLLDSLDRNLSDDVLWCGHRVKAVDYGYSANYSYSYSAKLLMIDIPYECATLNYDLPGIAP